jgi:heptosyltransferase-1
MHLASRIQRELRLTVVMLGGAEHSEQARRMLDNGPAGIMNLVGHTTLQQAAAVIKHARLVIGVDTGLSHLGVAFRRPMVALFGPTIPYTDPGCAQTVVLHEPLPCSPCKRRPTCGGEFTCMRLIGVDEVLCAASSLLHRFGPDR